MSSISGDHPNALSVVVYGINFEPELTGCGKYTGEMARWLASRGHAVHVVTAPPYYPQWEVAQGHRGWAYRQEQWGEGSELSVLRCPLWVPRKVTGTKRLIHLGTFALSSAFGLLYTLARRRADLILLVAPTLACAPAALILSRVFKVPIWLHVQDFEVDAMHAMGLVHQRGWLRQSALKIEAWIMQRFDRVSSISEKMVQRLHDKGVQPSRTVQFLNWVDVSAIHPKPRPDPNNTIRQMLGVSVDQTLILYAGNIGQKQGIDVVIDAARRLAHRKDLFFGMIGAGAALAQLKSQSQDLDQVRWLPLQPLELLNELLNAADIHVLPQRVDAADLVMPSKLTGMLASGRPVIGTAEADTQLGKVLDECGIRVPAGCAQALSNAIVELSEQPHEQIRLGELGREYALKHLSHSAVLGAFEGELQRLHAEQPTRITT